MQHEQEIQWLEAIRRREEQGLEALFKNYYRDLCRLAFRIVRQETVAEEIVQDVFLLLWEQGKDWDIRQSLVGYLRQMVRNRSLNHLKSRYAKLEGGQELQDFQHPAAEVTDEWLAQQELSELLEKGIATLPERCRIIFQLRLSTGMTYEEIGQELGLSKKTVAAQVQIALDKLKLYLGKNWEVLPATWLAYLLGDLP